MDAEFVLKNASVIEGNGLAPYKGHIHIVDGEIKAVIKEDSKLPKEKIETIVEYGLHQFVTQFIRKISSVDNEIHKEFFN